MARRCNATIPVSRFLDGALLFAKVDIDKPEALAITLSPFVIVKQAPGMVTTDVGSILDRAGELRQMAAIELDTSRIGNLVGVAWQRSVGVSTTILGNLDDGVVVLLRNARNDVVEPPGPDLPSVIGNGAYAALSAVVLNIRNIGRGRDNRPLVIVDANPVQRSLHDLAVTSLDAHGF